MPTPPPGRPWPPAPRWSTTHWLNTDHPLDVPDLAGRVVLLGAFQLLCPACVERTVPQLTLARAVFDVEDVAVVGLHTVFEHHRAMGVETLAAFVHEYGITFPVGVDAPGPEQDPVPVTMRRYGLRGTPTVLLLDRAGRVRRHVFGHLPDLQLGAEIASLVGEADVHRVVEPPTSEGSGAAADPADDAGHRCTSAGCPV